MLNKKSIKSRGKLKLSLYFQEFKEGDKVAVVREQSLNPEFPKRIQGLVGVIKGMKGKAYIVQIREGNKEKIHVIKPMHLKRL